MKEIPYVSEPLSFSEISRVDSPFVEIKNNSFFEVKMQYPILKMQNAEKRCLVRAEVYKFLIYDAWRPFELQKELYQKYSNDILARFGLEEYDDFKKEQIINKYVSKPTKDRELPPVHTTGGAIDLTIVDSKGKELNMGCMFDEFEEIAHTAYFENTEFLTIKNNRRLLYLAMIKAGFTNLPSEWWHYDYGDRFWGYYKNRPAIYTGCFDAKEITLKSLE